MLSKIINQLTKEVQVATGNNTEFYESLGFEDRECEQAYNGSWYLKGYAPIEPEIEKLKKQLNKLEQEYNMPRVIREGILNNPNAYSQFNVNRARALEEIAERIRKGEIK